MSGLRRTRAQPQSLAGLASPAESPTGGFWLAVRRRRGPCGWPYDVDRGLLVGRTTPVGQPETPCQQHLANQKPPVSSTWPTRNPLSAALGQPETPCQRQGRERMRPEVGTP